MVRAVVAPALVLVLALALVLAPLPPTAARVVSQHVLGRPHSRALGAVGVRGGATRPPVDQEEEEEEEEEEEAPLVKVLVQTGAGSPHLDVKAKLELPADTPIAAIKAAVESRMPGHPPVAVQRLVHGMRLLGDDEVLASLLAPAGGEEDEFSMDVEPTAPAAVREITLLLDVLPPLPVDKSLPAAVEAKLKAYAAEVVAVRHLLNRVAAGLPSTAAASDDEGEREFHLETSALRDEIRAMEAQVLHMCAHNLTARKETVNSAIIEDGRVDMSGVQSPWKATLLKISHQADVDWRATLGNMATMFFLARFATPGPEQALIINCVGVLILVLQTRPARFASKVLLGLAATNRGPLVDLVSTLLPTSHQVLLDAELGS